MQFGLRKVRRGPKPQLLFVSGRRLYLLDAVDDNKVKILIQRSTRYRPGAPKEMLHSLKESPNSTLRGCRNWRLLWLRNLLLAVLKKNVSEK
jgi:hypothetical protein